MRGADEHAAVASCRWIRFEQQQTLGQYAARFIEIDRADVGHRPQIGQHAQHLRRRPQPAWHQRFEEIEPGSPQRLGWPPVERLDDRERERPQVLELSDHVRDGREPRLPATLVQERLSLLPFELLRFAVEPPRPSSGAAADHGGLDEELLPAPRCAQRAGNHAIGIRGSVLIGVPIVHRLYGRATDRLILRRDPRRVDAVALRRHLSKREILGKPCRRERLCLAREQRQKRAAGGMRPSGAAVEPRRHSRAAQRVLEQTEIAVG